MTVKTGNILYFSLLLFLLLNLTEPKPVYANSTTQMDIIQSIVEEQLLYDEGLKPASRHPVIKEVLKIRGRRTGEPLPSYLLSVAKNQMPVTFLTQYKTVDAILHDERLVIRLLGYTGDPQEQKKWGDEVVQILFSITEPSVVDRISVQVWDGSGGVHAVQYNR